MKRIKSWLESNITAMPTARVKKLVIVLKQSRDYKQFVTDMGCLL